MRVWRMFHKIISMLRELKAIEASYINSIVEAVEETPTVVTVEVSEYIQTETNVQASNTLRAPLKTDVVPEDTTENNDQIVIYDKKTISKDEARKILAQLTITPTDFANIQPSPSQVWNCDTIDIDLNGQWTKVVCTYKYCMVDQIGKI